MRALEVGDKVTFVRQTCETITEIPLGSVGILSDKTDEDKLNCYVVFNSLKDVEWFNEDELELV